MLLMEHIFTWSAWQDNLQVRLMTNRTYHWTRQIDPIGVWHVHTPWRVLLWRIAGKARHFLGLAPQQAWRR